MSPTTHGLVRRLTGNHQGFLAVDGRAAAEPVMPPTPPGQERGAQQVQQPSVGPVRRRRRAHHNRPQRRQGPYVVPAHGVEPPPEVAQHNTPTANEVEQAVDEPLTEATININDEASTETDRPYYERYRTLPIILRESTFLPDEVVQAQRKELQDALTFGPVEEPTFPAEDGQSTCVLCLVNTPTRMAIPCGHNVVCRECLPMFVGQNIYYRVTSSGGNILETRFRLPITCPTCRAIVGQVIPTYL